MSNGIKIYNIAITILALALLILCVSLLYIKSSQEREILILTSQARGLRNELPDVKSNHIKWWREGIE